MVLHLTCTTEAPRGLSSTDRNLKCQLVHLLIVPIGSNTAPPSLPHIASAPIPFSALPHSKALRSLSSLATSHFLPAFPCQRQLQEDSLPRQQNVMAALWLNQPASTPALLDWASAALTAGLTHSPILCMDSCHPNTHIYGSNLGSSPP